MRMDNFWLPYLLIMAHFVSGAFWLLLINRKAEPDFVREQWIKYGVYLVLFNLIWHSVVWFASVFLILGYTIIIIGMLEWWKTIKGEEYKLWLASGMILVMVGFWRFLTLEKTEIIFTFFVVVLFDGACQISGQLVGKRILAPRISPRKTLEGLVGGTIVTLATALMVRNAFALDVPKILQMTLLIMMAAFVGDLAASAMKRKAGKKHFSHALPGHGGILDRYDSLIMAGGVMYIISLISN